MAEQTKTTRTEVVTFRLTPDEARHLAAASELEGAFRATVARRGALREVRRILRGAATAEDAAGEEGRRAEP